MKQQHYAYNRITEGFQLWGCVENGIRKTDLQQKDLLQNKTTIKQNTLYTLSYYN